MKTDINEIEINGVKYVPKGTQLEPVMDPKNTVLVRCKSAGVFFGELVTPSNIPHGIVVLKNARRCWYWSGAASLSQLAVDGTSKPKECKFPVAVNSITLTEVIEVIPCTETAVKSLTSVPVWKA